VSTASIPSKTYYLMSAGAVIYAETDESSELNRLINLHNLGMSDNSKDNKEMVDFILKCRYDESLLLGYKRNSRKASLNYTRENAKLLYKEMVREKNSEEL
jgi:hypothetical protein